MPSLRPVCAMLSGCHSAEFDQNIRGRFGAAGCLAAHDTGQRVDTLIVGDHANQFVEGIGLAVERQQCFAGARTAHRQIAVHFRRIEHVERAAAVVGDEIGNIDQRIDRAEPDRGEPFLQPVRRRSVLDAAHRAERKARAQRRRRPEIERDVYRTGELALHRPDRRVLELAHIGCGKIAGNAVHAGGVGAVRGQVDLDHRIVEPGIVRVRLADRRIVRQIDDAVVIVGDLEFGFGDQHAAAFDVADLADAERDVLAGDESAGRREHALHAGARVRRAADHLDRRARTGVDHADPQPVGIRVLPGISDMGDDKRCEGFCFVLDALDL